MFKKLDDLENAMYNVMITLDNNPNKLLSLHDSIDLPIALHQCLSDKYIENIEEWKDADGNYHFDIIGNVHINKRGLEFMKNMSFPFRLKTAIFDILKGTLGFVLGILGTIIAEIIIWKLTSP